MDNKLYHAGIKGQKWGVRRYQNKDGTLTDLGKKRYARDAGERGYDKQDGTGYYKTTGKKNRREDLKVDADRYVKEDRERSRRVLDESSQMTSKLKNITDQSLRNRKKPAMDLSNMTDQQMRNEINRAMLERQYNDMFAPQKPARGREIVSKTLEVAGAVLGIGSSALGIALAIKELRGPKSISG